MASFLKISPLTTDLQHYQICKPKVNKTKKSNQVMNKGQYDYQVNKMTNKAMNKLLKLWLFIGQLFPETIAKW